MAVNGQTTLIGILLLLATAAAAVEPYQTTDGVYQEEAFPEGDEETDEVAEDDTERDETSTDAVDVTAKDEVEKEETSTDAADAWVETDTDSYEHIYDPPFQEDSMLSVMDKPHEYVSENIEWLVTRFDRFFANDALYRYTTGSYVQISGDTLIEESGEVGYDLKFRGRVDLPGTKRRFKLILNTNPSERQDPLERSVDESPGTAVEESDVFGSIQRERTLRGWKFRPSVGAKFSLPIVPFVKARFTRIYPLQTWAMRADQNFYWFDDNGFGSDSTIEFDRPIGQEHLFRASSFARWTEETNYFQLNQVLTFFQTLSPNRKISYQIGAYGQTQPTWFMTDYLAVIRYRQNLHKDWFFFEVRPQVKYSKINDWDDEVSLLLRLELFFGRKYL